MDQQTEGTVLLYCLGMGTDEIRAARLEQLSSSDWDKVIQQWGRHGVTALPAFKDTQSSHKYSEGERGVQKAFSKVRLKG